MQGKQKRNRVITQMILGLIIILYLYAFFSAKNAYSIPAHIYLSFFPVGIIAIIEILRDKLEYSINKMHWYFLFIFMFLSPISMLRSGYKPWNHPFDNSIVLYVNFLLTVWELLYIFAYYHRSRIRIGRKKKIKTSKQIHLKRSDRVLLVILSLGSTALMVMSAGFQNLFIRDFAVFGDGTFSIMFAYLFRSIPVLNCGLLCIQRKKSNDVPLFEIIVTFVCAFLVNSPIAISRYWSGTVYLGLLICFIPDGWLRGRRFDYIILGALMIVFPFFSVFKRYTLQTLGQANIDINILTVFNSVDFDAYSMLCRIIEYTRAVGFTLGTQLRSTLLFFVPRAIWNIKGTPTGELVASYQGSYFTNVSSPLMGEGYIDFAMIGLMAYAVVAGKLFWKIDNDYWVGERDNKTHYIELILPFMLGFVVFLMRGALQSVFLRIMGFFLYLILIYWVSRFFAGLRRNKK